MSISKGMGRGGVCAYSGVEVKRSLSGAFCLHL